MTERELERQRPSDRRYIRPQQHEDDHGPEMFAMVFILGLLMLGLAAAVVLAMDLMNTRRI